LEILSGKIGSHDQFFAAGAITRGRLSGSSRASRHPASNPWTGIYRLGSAFTGSPEVSVCRIFWLFIDRSYFCSCCGSHAEFDGPTPDTTVSVLHYRDRRMNTIHNRPGLSFGLVVIRPRLLKRVPRSETIGIRLAQQLKTDAVSLGQNANPTQHWRYMLPNRELSHSYDRADQV
jgi:hypothetical protein